MYSERHTAKERYIENKLIMANRRLAPMCEELLYRLVEREERQIREAYPRLKAKGMTHTYYARGDDGKQKSWHDCVSCYTIVIRYDESADRFVSHYKGEQWHDLYYENARQLCECADFLLRMAYESE